MDISSLEKVLEKEPKYRIKQAKEQIFKNFISNWDQATVFGKELREKLNKECPLEIKADVLVSREEDSVKARITLNDGLKIETVLMKQYCLRFLPSWLPFGLRFLRYWKNGF